MAVVLTPLAMALVPFASLASGAAGASQDPGGSGWGGWGGHGEPALTARTILAGGSLTHTFTVAGTSTVTSGPLSSPDDITMLGRDIFVGFQNGVGPQGQPSSSGNQDSTIVEMSQGGQPIAQWDVAGKADGVTADPATRTVHRDSERGRRIRSLYTITPGWGGGVQHYRYNEPLPHGGGTDAISVVDGRLYISASAPGTTGMLPAPQPTFPAVYTVSLDRFDSIATVTPLFYDEDPATVANVGTADEWSDGPAGTDGPGLERGRSSRCSWFRG